MMIPSRIPRRSNNDQGALTAAATDRLFRTLLVLMAAPSSADVSVSSPRMGSDSGSTPTGLSVDDDGPSSPPPPSTWGGAAATRSTRKTMTLKQNRSTEMA